MEDNRLLDFGNYPIIAANGLADVQFIERDAQFFLFGWRRIDGIWRKVVTGLVIRPAASLRPEQLTTLTKLYADGMMRH